MNPYCEKLYQAKFDISTVLTTISKDYYNRKGVHSGTTGKFVGVVKIERLCKVWLSACLCCVFVHVRRHCEIRVHESAWGILYQIVQVPHGEYCTNLYRYHMGNNVPTCTGTI